MGYTSTQKYAGSLLTLAVAEKTKTFRFYLLSEYLFCRTATGGELLVDV